MLTDAISKTDAILANVARVKVRVWLIADSLKLNGKENTPFYCHAVMQCLIK